MHDRSSGGRGGAGARWETSDPEELEKQRAREQRRAERDERQRRLRAEAKAAVERIESGRAGATSRRSRPKRAKQRAALGGGPAHGGDEVVGLNRLLGPVEARKQLRKLRAASNAYGAERFDEARRSAAQLATLAPSVPEIRELHGLALYRLGRYREAARELEEFRVLAGSTEQNPVLMDCYRAQERWADVEELWTECADASPSAAVVNEGRIVWAAAMADQGDLDGAVGALSKGWKRPTRPLEHHLRRAYALADLYERSGDMARARSLFEWLVSKAPDFVDVRDRLRALR